MGLPPFLIYLLLGFTYCQSLARASTCEETETAHVKLDLAKQSIHSAKYLFPKCENETNSSNCSIKDRSLAHLNAALDLISEAKSMCHTCSDVIVTEEPKGNITEVPEVIVTENPDVIIPHSKPMDCSEILNKGFNQSGVYEIWPKGPGISPNESIHVYCDMETDGGGWTVIQRRGDFKPRWDFYQDWQTYKKGFGDIKKEFWLGNDKIFTLTNQGNYSVRFDLKDVKQEYRYATYSSFSVGDENSGYVLSIHEYSGNASDGMNIHHGAKFSTKDEQNDGRSSGSSCAQMYKAAFWYSEGCGYVSLNGIYEPGAKNNAEKIWWYTWKQSYECLYSVEIKIRRKYHSRERTIN